MDAQKTNTTAKDVDANSALPMGKNAINAKKKGQFAEQCHSKAIADASSKRFGQQKQILGPRKSFAKQLQTQEIAKQTSQTLTK